MNKDDYDEDDYDEEEDNWEVDCPNCKETFIIPDSLENYDNETICPNCGYMLSEADLDDFFEMELPKNKFGTEHSI